jgi:hypothetical protein
MSSIQNNDLTGHVGEMFSIDQYKSKIGKDENVVVVAFNVKDNLPAKDLSLFIETGHDVIDTDVSPGPNNDGDYKVYVELERNTKLFESIDNILKDITRLDNEATGFTFTSYKNDTPVKWSKESLENNVFTSSYDYVLATNPEAQAIKERIEFLNSY